MFSKEPEIYYKQNEGDYYGGAGGRAGTAHQAQSSGAALRRKSPLRRSPGKYDYGTNAGQHHLQL